MAQSEIHSKIGAQNTVWSEEFERMPLKQRLKLLFASNRISVDSELKSEEIQKNCHLGEFNNEKNSENKCVKSSHITAAGVSEKAGSVGLNSLRESLVVENPIKVKIEGGENNVESCLEDCMHISNGVGIEANSETETRLQFLDELDHVVLKERLRRLLVSECLGLSSPVLEASHYLSGDTIVQTLDIPSLVNVKAEPSNRDEFQSSTISIVGPMSSSNFVLVKNEVQTAGDAHEDDLDHMLLRERIKLLLSRGAPSLHINRSPKSMSKMTHSALGCRLDRSKPAHSVKINHPRKRQKTVMDLVETAVEEDAPGLFQVLIDKSVTVDEIKLYGESESNGALDDSSTKDSFGELEEVITKASHYLSGDSRIVQTPDITSFVNVKVEPPNPDEFQSSNVDTVGQMSSSNFVLVKTEVQTAGDAHEDDLDHMLLRERMKLLSSRDASLNSYQNPKSRSKMTHSASGCRLDRSKPAHSVKINHPRKRRKTATDSVETAMEEDAPGLLQVLIDKGVTVDEIKLYGEPESNDALDDSSSKDSFGELEEVITKVGKMICELFSQRESLLKYGPLRCSRGERASYCLECLFSLVEQARYLQFRNWPVEWGWCRDLQSFIFVFERHNRVVLERPEYGYATYFFELADSLPIDWQIKRLVIAMKLTSCSRVTLIENKALMVGDDLSEGEARVLTEYGWIPNTGLGTMLNYYDRVVHDRKNEKDGSEWRSKIGKLLMDGYNGGTIVPTVIPTKVAEYNAANDVQIKLELS